jgi:large repetitive protein
VTLANGPISTADPWLAANAIQTTGNNVDAYADLSAPDGFSVGDERASTTSQRTFDYRPDMQRQPGANPTQRKASVTQLFYDINFLHDWFYDSGFNEAAGNAQTDNYGRGGVAGDSIHAEAQDYAGRNNANMSTPPDGGHPRMQLYLSDAITFRALTINSPSALAGQYGVGTAVFGAHVFNLTGNIVAALPADGCAALGSSVAGKIAFIDRGTCNFTVKVQNAQNAGALAVIVGNVAGSPDASSIVGMGCSTTPCAPLEQALIPSFMLPLESAEAVRNSLTAGAVHATLRHDAGIDRDTTDDYSAVAHEWGHYLSHRLIADSAGLVSNQSRGMGEGWSDFVALLAMVRAEDSSVASNATFNGAYPIGAFINGGGANGPIPNGGYYFGIRRAPYSTEMTRNPLTLRHVVNGQPISGAPLSFGADGLNNAEVHNTGEVWATMLWECYAALLGDTLGAQPRLTFAEAQQRMKDYLVASLKITPADPTFLDSRNALLAAAFASDRTDYLRFWQAFAKRGAGTRATIAERYSTSNAGVTEDFTLGGGCRHQRARGR